MATGLMEKKNTKSPVWRYFAFEADANGKPKDIDKPKCKLCYEEVTAHFGNTSNLYMYIKNKHPFVYTDLAKERQESSSLEARRAAHKLRLPLFSRNQGSSIKTRENTKS